jgi:signal peptidase I
VTIRIPKAVLVLLGIAVVGGVGVAVGLLLAGGDDEKSNSPTYRVPSASMEPTFKSGEVVQVDTDKEAQVGDVIVFYPPAVAVSGGQGECGVISSKPGQPCTRPTEKRANVIFIKRVVAGPGNAVAIRDGHTVLNGQIQDEPFTAPCGPVGECSFPTPFKVPPDHMFLLGDNRGESDDSRFWGPVPQKWVLGVVDEK